MDDFRLRLREISDSAYLEFGEMLDYIWKSPQLVRMLEREEMQKVRSYFPNDPKNARLRLHFELRKLRGSFPYYISAGNLFNAISLFESYLLVLKSVLEESLPESRVSDRGSAFWVLSEVAKARGVSLQSISAHEQVVIALKFRNCLAHASGMLEMSRDPRAIRAAVESGSYLTKLHRDARREKGDPLDEARIETSDLGDRLVVTSTYSWIACSYLRDYLVDVASLCSNKMNDSA